MDTYLYCSDSAARRGTPVAHLTPRCWFTAADLAAARQVLAQIEALRFPHGRRFGVAGVRRETARERQRLVSPSERLPECHEWLESLGYEPRDPARGVGGLGATER